VHAFAKFRWVATTVLVA